MDLSSPKRDKPNPASLDDDSLHDKHDHPLTHVVSLQHGSHSPTQLTQKFSLVSMLALAFCVLGTWSTFAQDLGTGLTTGGPVAILWGLVLVTVCNLCVAVSLGELVSSMPTALGQAYWVHRLWPTGAGRFASYVCAWINTFGWWTLTASQVGFMANFTLGIGVMFDNDWEGAQTGWVQFLVYLAIALIFTGVNLVACRRESFLPRYNNFVGAGFALLFVVFAMVLLICVGTKPGLHFQPASFALGGWINQTGWSDGVVWFIGLVQAAYGLTAFDSVIHMVEEIPDPRRNAPKAIHLAVLCGAISGFIFMVVCLFCIQNIDTVLNSPTDLPFMQLVLDAVGSVGGAAALMALFVFNGVGQGVSIATTASRLTWGFARDGGIPFFRYFSVIDSYWKAPIRALWLQGVLIGLVGVLYLFANTVLQAILSVSTIALTISYGMPILTLLMVGRDRLPPGGSFRLGRFGAWINWVSVIYCAVTTVFFFFPNAPNPTPSDMNWAIAVFGVMLVVALGFWFVQGARTYLTTEFAEERMAYARHLEEK